jgi:preprotein translocase subunit SecG
MEQLILVVYVLLSAAMIGLILLQQGKGADVGASFGSGASQTVFGSVGSGNVLTRSTAILATAFFLASVGLAVMAKHKAEGLREGVIPVPAVTESREAQQLPGDLPVSATDAAVPAAGPDVPVAPGAEAQQDVPAAAMQQIPAPQAGNQAAQDVPSPPSEQPATEGRAQ